MTFIQKVNCILELNIKQKCLLKLPTIFLDAHNYLPHVLEVSKLLQLRSLISRGHRRSLTPT